jgi:hypothetical protein
LEQIMAKVPTATPLWPVKSMVEVGLTGLHNICLNKLKNIVTHTKITKSLLGLLNAMKPSLSIVRWQMLTCPMGHTTLIFLMTATTDIAVPSYCRAAIHHFAPNTLLTAFCVLLWNGRANGILRIPWMERTKYLEVKWWTGHLPVP